MYEKAEDLGYDRWPEVLEAAGIPKSHFSGKNGPCPMCGGKDRFRWAKKSGGLWVCSNCTGSGYSSPIKLLMMHMGYHEFRDAANHVREYFGENSTTKCVVRPTLQQTAMSDEEQFQKNRLKMEKLWNEAVQLTVDDPADMYLQRRVPGVQADTRNLRFHRALPYWAPPEHDGGKPVLLGYFPAMLARAQAANGDFVQLHKTYLTDDGYKADVPIAKKTERGVGCNAFAIRIGDVNGDTLGVAEGIESAFAASMIRNIPVWPCLNGPSMERFELPTDLQGRVKRLVIFADHDEAKIRRQGILRKPGALFAAGLAQRARAMGLRPLVIMPARVGQDMADQWVIQNA